MPDYVSPEDRALIDAYLAKAKAEGRDLKVPRVQPAPYVWQPSAHGEGKLVPREAGGWRKGIRFVNHHAERMRREREDRDAQMARFAASCPPVEALARTMAKFDASEWVVRRACRDHGVPLLTRHQIAAAEIDARVAALADGTRCLREVAALTGLDRGTVAERRARLGLNIPDGRGGRPRKDESEAA